MSMIQLLRKQVTQDKAALRAARRAQKRDAADLRREISATVREIRKGRGEYLLPLWSRYQMLQDERRNLARRQMQERENMGNAIRVASLRVKASRKLWPHQRAAALEAAKFEAAKERAKLLGELERLAADVERDKMRIRGVLVRKGVPLVDLQPAGARLSAAPTRKKTARKKASAKKTAAKKSPKAQSTKAKAPAKKKTAKKTTKKGGTVRKATAKKAPAKKATKATGADFAARMAKARAAKKAKAKKS